MYTFAPSITVATAVTTATPMITPSKVRKDLSLWAMIDDIAILEASMNLYIIPIQIQNTVGYCFGVSDSIITTRRETLQRGEKKGSLRCPFCV
jgi:hypothetical protein